MEGLEISEIKYSEYIQTYRLRLDSDYYLKAYLANEKYLASKNSIKDISFSNILNIKNLRLKKDFNYLEISGIKSNSLSYSYNKINFKEIPDRATYILSNNDVVVSTVRPNRNSVAFIHNANRLIGTSGLTVLRADSTKISPYYLFVFCKTKFFITKLMRENTATMYPAVSDYDVLNVKIPILSISFQQIINNKIEHAFKCIKQSQSLYKQAEKLLLETLGLNDFRPSQETINIKPFKESFLEKGRLDAEYYQPKYENIITHIKTFETKQLGEIANIKKSIEPGSDAYESEGIPFIRVSNMTKFGITETDIFLDKVKYGNLDLQPKKDTILLSKDGSVGIAYKFEQDLDVITSGALLHLTVEDKDFLPDYITLVLNSIIVKMQAERDAGGSIIQHWKPSEIEQVIIPKLPMATQEKIASLVQESFALRKESERLLIEAKEMVEREIEDGIYN